MAFPTSRMQHCCVVVRKDKGRALTHMQSESEQRQPRPCRSGHRPTPACSRVYLDPSGVRPKASVRRALIDCQFGSDRLSTIIHNLA
ncbi:unnamed protein product [Heligmosomoides polygyrus]|uniref:Transposase n=1 Tax=Heligmosomoides polygyrus TaxID=6339 RepID=A0A183F5N9_HELPZ|nr:unnamed protein product [Heligmosomoides polygyrus]